MIMELLKQLYCIHSPSGNERAMKKFIRRYIRKHIPGAKIETDQTGNLYIIKGTAPSYPCIVAHLDQVQRAHSKDFSLMETKELIFGYSRKRRRQEGLGADDKNGIWIALRCLERYGILKVAFFVEEETGCRGSSQARMEFFNNARFVIQPDRRGYKDLVTTIGWTELCSREFLMAAGYERFGYQETEGAMTDILALKENGLAVSCINLSCGYYEPHTDMEFTVKKDLLNCLKLVEHIIEVCTMFYPHTDRHAGCFMGTDEYKAAKSEMFGMLEYDDTLAFDDIYLLLNPYFPNLTEDDFIRIYLEYYNPDSENIYNKV